MSDNKPAYLNLSAQDFEGRIEKGGRILSRCSLCPRLCRVNRLRNERGFCRAGKELEVAHWQRHFGEEPPLSQNGGAGAVFFAHCNLNCVYCQNCQISRQTDEDTQTISPQELAGIMLELQKQGARNIDLVSPAHFVPHIIEAVYLARGKGLCLPLVYNTNGYEHPRTLELLDGIIDIYLPDFKYGNDQTASEYSQAPDYVKVTCRAIVLMHQQAGDLRLDKNSTARRGLFVRHLVLPERLAGSFFVLDYLKKSTGVNIGLSLMSQYTPCYKAKEYEKLAREITPKEYREVVDYARELGFDTCWIQELASSSQYLPDFDEEKVFKDPA